MDLLRRPPPGRQAVRSMGRGDLARDQVIHLPTLWGGRPVRAGWGGAARLNGDSLKRLRVAEAALLPHLAVPLAHELLAVPLATRLGNLALVLAPVSYTHLRAH